MILLACTLGAYCYAICALIEIMEYIGTPQ